jgi:HJR/Mrr/RecB family endonuclease
MPVKVVKVNGEIENYSEEKIRSSAARVGVPSDLTEAMLTEIREKLYDGIPTTEIFQIIKNYLNQSSTPHLASKYNLKAALAELGPSGYPFEQYIAALLKELGYQVETNKTIAGKCVTHEVDVLAYQDNLTYFIEAKFHRHHTQRSDVKVPLYIRARYEDISSAFSKPSAPWIITNTRFSKDALSYALCREIKLTSWGYPKGEGIMDLIEKTGLHPITMLDGLTAADKKLLLSQNIVTCRQFVTDKNVSQLIPNSRRRRILSQAKMICQK